MASEDQLLPLLYAVEIGDATYAVRTITGEEGLSRPRRFEIELHVEPHDTLDPDAVIGGEAVVRLTRDAPLRRIRCVVTSAARAATRKGNAGAAKVTLVLEARLAITRFRVDIRIFREKTAPEIVTEVLEAHGLTVESRLVGSYTRRPYCVQMRESDLDFASRLLEDEGIFYVVDDEGRVILGDHAAAYLEGPGLLWFAHDAGLFGQRDAVYHVGWAGRATAGKVSLRDFNPEKPRLDMDVSARGPTASGPEWYDYPGEYEVPALGQIKANLRAEALACQKRRLAGRSSCARLATGGLFSLFDAPAGVEDREYVVTRLTHAWDREASSFTVGFEALPSSTVFRPPVVTHVPTFPAPLTGFCTGPAGSDIYTDAWGRVKVHFQWDRLQPKDDTCSHWIPVLQDNTGRSSSMARIGWEVLCQFLEGDPDRPVVLGRVFNPTDPFTEELPTRKMRITLQSLTSPRATDAASGYNMVRFDDMAGAQTIDLHAQKDQNIHVANNQDEKIDAIEQREIKGNEKIKIGSNETIDVTIDSVAKVDGNQTVTISGSRTIDVTGRHNENVEKDHLLKIGGDHTRDVHTDDNLAVARDLTEHITGSVFEQSDRNNVLSGGKTSRLIVSGSITEIAQLGKSEGTQHDRSETVRGASFSSADEKHAARTEVSRTLTVGGSYMVTALKEILVAGLDLVHVDATDISFTAPSITLKVGETTLHLKNGRIDLNAPETITIDTQQVNNLGATTSSQN